MPSKTRNSGGSIQAGINRHAALFKPQETGPQISVPSWKEGSPEWCAAVRRLDAAKRKKEGQS